ncbi:MAG: hypothetical protein C0186_06430 [Thermodesulfovibrio aggregans]|uniref:Uncharacterized protein n=2 Tax=Thermodesulfovibrio TaxID=28261 RepID=A0A2J6WGW2_9BACT|nr:MAG: hypothetical protein C0186_06430 [Thermodesulfovibrio aggregans]
MLVYYSLGNRNYWFAPIEKVIKISEILSRKNYLLYDTEALKGVYNDWFILNDEYVKKLSDIIEEVLEDIDDEEIVDELFALKNVLEGGSVVVG